MYYCVIVIRAPLGAVTGPRKSAPSEKTVLIYIRLEDAYYFHRQYFREIINQK